MRLLDIDWLIVMGMRIEELPQQPLEVWTHANASKHTSTNLSGEGQSLPKLPSLIRLKRISLQAIHTPQTLPISCNYHWYTQCKRWQDQSNHATAAWLKLNRIVFKWSDWYQPHQTENAELGEVILTKPFKVGWNHTSILFFQNNRGSAMYTS